jgi:hypothetical protein
VESGFREREDGESIHMGTSRLQPWIDIYSYFTSAGANLTELVPIPIDREEILRNGYQLLEQIPTNREKVEFPETHGHYKWISE